jgi:hypothetical protein
MSRWPSPLTTTAPWRDCARARPRPKAGEVQRLLGAPEAVAGQPRVGQEVIAPLRPVRPEGRRAAGERDAEVGVGERGGAGRQQQGNGCQEFHRSVSSKRMKRRRPKEPLISCEKGQPSSASGQRRISWEASLSPAGAQQTQSPGPRQATERRERVQSSGETEPRRRPLAWTSRRPRPRPAPRRRLVLARRAPLSASLVCSFK